MHDDSGRFVVYFLLTHSQLSPIPALSQPYLSPISALSHGYLSARITSATPLWAPQEPPAAVSDTSGRQDTPPE